MEALVVASEISLKLSRDQAVVLFEWLGRTGSAGFPAEFEDQAEQRILWDLESLLEAVLTEPLGDDYRGRLEKARMALRDSTE